MHYPMALDAKRWNLSPMPEALNYAGAVLIPIKGLPGYWRLCCARALQANPRCVVNLVASAVALTSDFKRISDALTRSSEVSK